MDASDRIVLVAGALLAGSGVAMGAFGAHALKDSLSPAAMGWWQTAVQYQMWHAVALVALGCAPARQPRLAGMLLGLGVLVFSGSLYAMALSGARWLGAVTPLGGSLMIAGWAWLAWRALGRSASPPDR